MCLCRGHLQSALPTSLFATVSIFAAVACNEPVEPTDVATQDAYDRCESTNECSDNTQCHDVVLDYGSSVVADTMCTIPCDRDEECLYGGRCVHPADQPALCYRRCLGDLDCYDGF